MGISTSRNATSHYALKKTCFGVIESPLPLPFPRPNRDIRARTLFTVHREIITSGSVQESSRHLSLSFSLCLSLFREKAFAALQAIPSYTNGYAPVDFSIENLDNRRYARAFSRRGFSNRDFLLRTRKERTARTVCITRLLIYAARLSSRFDRGADR